MNPLDRIVAKGMQSVLEEDLGKSTFKKIEKEVFDVYGISIEEAVADFSKLDLVLRKFFGKHTTNIESKIFKKILSVDNNTKTDSVITIKDPNIAKVVFESYGDPAKKIILDLLQKEPGTIPEAISKSKLPKASTYNRIKELVQDGLLTIVGHTKASDGRKVTQYCPTFNKAVFEIEDGDLLVNVNVQNKFVKDSFTFNSINERSNI